MRLAEAFVYLAVVLDAFSRKVVGWAMADHLRASLTLDAFEMALGSREVIAGGLVHHSDRGIQYACGDYIARLEAAGIQPSMSRAGCPYDNAMAESFMKTLKHEEVDASAYRDLAYARGPSGSSSRPHTTVKGSTRFLPTCRRWSSNLASPGLERSRAVRDFLFPPKGFSPHPQAVRQP